MRMADSTDDNQTLAGAQQLTTMILQSPHLQVHKQLGVGGHAVQAVQVLPEELRERAPGRVREQGRVRRARRAGPEGQRGERPLQVGLIERRPGGQVHARVRYCVQHSLLSH